ncbi:uncharacterized protein LOC112171328 [Rosa chinensis]|uniref:uncharacterized protein LOC112171328 n=1 Tax=Rosa chinensis TaxID=74649 RepID=UPI000D08E2C3|nr:uncharacterized protein LOC112171328 [Rosa chinensis]
MWRLTGTVEVQPRGDHFLFMFTHECDVARVKKGGPWGFQRAMILLNDYDGFLEIPAGILMEPTVRLVGGTIREVLEVDRVALRRGEARVRLTLPINDPVRLDSRVRVSPIDILTLRFRYERLLGRCSLCALLNHGRQRCLREGEVEVDTVVEEDLTQAPGLALPALVFRANS